MAIQYDEDTGHPYLSNQSLLSDVPAYTQALMAANLTPVGVIMPYMGMTAPDYWLLCDGRDYAVDKLPELAAVNSNFHDDGTFRVPDLRGRSPMGAHSDGDSSNIIRNIAIGKRTGDQRMAGHNHGGDTGPDYPDHTHALETSDYSFGQNNSAGAYGSTLGSAAHTRRHIQTLGSGWWSGPNPGGSLQPTRHQHGIPGDGSGLSENVHPVTGVTFIVYAGRPTLPPADLGGSGQPMTLATSVRMMQDRLAEPDISEYEREMIEAKLNGEPWPPEIEPTESIVTSSYTDHDSTKGQLP